MTNERNGYHYHGEQEEDFEDEFLEEETLLSDELDHQILMHREAHFGGSFDVMIEYYAEEKIGCHPEIDLERIEYLAGIEKESGKNLAPLLLTASEAEAVAKAKKAYKDFKKIYESNRPESKYARLIADLILSEEEEPEKEMELVADEGRAIVPTLLSLIKSEDTYDPLFPGYGYAPYLAILCLGRIKDPMAIIPIFETLSKETLFGEEAAVAALVEIGDKAKEFLLELIHSRPLTKDNITAAFVLSAFPPDIEIAKHVLTELKDPKVRANPILSTYLLGSIDPIGSLPEKKEFIALSKEENIPKGLKVEMERTIRSWEK